MLFSTIFITVSFATNRIIRRTFDKKIMIRFVLEVLFHYYAIVAFIWFSQVIVGQLARRFHHLPKASAIISKKQTERENTRASRLAQKGKKPVGHEEMLDWSATRIAQEVREGKCKAKDVVEAFCARAHAADIEINCLTSTRYELVGWI